jgi:DNA processing protein
MDFFYWFALKSISHVGNVTFRRLVERFGDPENVFKASARDLASIKGMHTGALSSIINRDGKAEAEKECRAVERAGVRIVTFLSLEYPKALVEVHDHPPFLYVKGTLRADELSVAIVGSRRASNYGTTTAEKLARDLSAQGITVVSGLARGIDTAAHRGALKAGGRSIGVLGCGIDVVYPRENVRIFDELQKKGALVSEFPMGTEPRAENFPRRNRIISGISSGVLVVEATENSGSLITAQYALEQGREVFAVPGNINYGSSRGTNSLIKQGAKLVECTGDILEELPQAVKSVNPRVADAVQALSPIEANVVALLAPNPLHIDEIIAKSALTAGEVSAILLRLELNGLITQLPGMYFQVA